jgi:class 3 adenylate cyclase
MALSPLAQTRLNDLRSSAADPRVVDALAHLMTEGDALDGYKLNAFRLAQQLGVSREDAVRALLFAARLGLFDLNWDVHCPSCKGVPEFSRHLMQLRERSHCGLCRIEYGVDFASQVEVTFTLNPEVRPIAFKEFSERVYPEHIEWFMKIGAREGRQPIRGAEGVYQPQEQRTIRVELAPGEYEAYVPSHHAVGTRIHVREGGATELLSISVGPDGSVLPAELVLAPGLRELQVTFGYPKMWALAFFPVGEPTNWVSAAYVTSLQDFRDLFSGEFLAPDVSFAVRSTTLMFTDIKGSTEMYERLGDAAAYRRVQDHFRLMTEIIRRNRGGVVKTIGDAVMASFPVNRDGVNAALEIQREFRAHSRELEGIEVKLGLHRGPAIAVTSNRLLDFFGRTVNIAARVQGESAASEIVLSPDVVADRAADALLRQAGLVCSTRRAHLKGIAADLTLHAVRLVEI